MKVLHITNNYPTPNLPIFGIFVKEQIDSLTDIGIDNKVFFVNGYEKGKLEYFKGVLKLRKYLVKNEYDLVHCHHVLTGLMFLLTMRFKRTPRVISFQNDPKNEHGLMLFRIIKQFFNVLIFKNNSDLIPKLNGKGFYLPNGVNTDFFKPIDKKVAKEKLKLDINKNYILFISSFLIRKQKRIDRFDETMRILKKLYPQYNFEELKLVNKGREYMPLYFNASSVHLLTSDFEGSPNSVKESLCCNTPVVATNVGNIKEMIEGSGNCYVSENFEPENLAKLVVKAIETEGVPRNLIFSKELDQKSISIKIYELYKRTLNNDEK
jgi:teichuronic acid biosynthesis glycosyltransferase TuaC